MAHLLWSAACISLTLATLFQITVVHAVPLNIATRANGCSQSSKRTYDIPITHSRTPSSLRRRAGISGTSGLGDNSDLLYAIPVEFENAQLTASFHLDTGSSDLWVTTDKCTSSGCSLTTSVHYPSSALQFDSPAVPLMMYYGDSATGTFARGNVAEETVTVAGIAMPGQHFGAIDDTTNPVVAFGTSGIFGLGFPSGSKVLQAVVDFENNNPTTTDALVNAMFIDGPLLSRLAMTGNLEHPMFSITLQRVTLDTEGSAPGLLTVGKLPEGVSDDEMTWVPVKLYTEAEGGLAPPSFARNEVYPYRWEVEIDGVFLDGEELPSSNISAGPGANRGKISALIDTGNSLLRGPSDVVDNVLSKVSPTYQRNKRANPILPCNIPRTMAFKIGGKIFPVDPRDFISPGPVGDTENCVADNLVKTDPPSRGSLFSWSLGDPFMKSNLVAFYYGNLTHPSVDPPRIGFKSLVPANAGELLQQAVTDAKASGGLFESEFIAAPTEVAHEEPETTILPGVTNTKAPSTPTPLVSTTASIPREQIAKATTPNISAQPQPSSSIPAFTTSEENNNATRPSASLYMVMVLGLVMGIFFDR